ncbi:hypothetical protein CLOM_g9035 [Closterium sp. NIES-68]|nr:hypothetical protein CLOM_g9035 [Closterium sp. NIES-68]GJP85122.1 hypothetical protein CLOP_g15216 [Closterium sp. NIES-67]
MAATVSRALTVTCAAAARHVTAAGSSSAQQQVQWTARALENKPMSELRALAKQRGLRGDTKAELIALLTSTGNLSASSASVSASASASASAAGAEGQRQRQLDVLPLAQLRAMARSRGLNASGSKAQLVKDLLVAELGLTASAPSTSTSALRGAPPPSPPPASPSASAPSAPAPASPSKTWKNQLQAQPLSALRALARERGLRGDTRAELITALSVDPPAGSELPGLVPNLPASFDLPFQSEVQAGGSALEPAQASKLAAELASLSATMQVLQSKQAALSGERDSLREQADLLRNVLVGGLGLALVPLLLPLQATNTAVQGSSSVTASVTQALPPPALPAPEVRELAPEDFCRTLPASLLSPDLARFCQAVNDLGL